MSSIKSGVDKIRVDALETVDVDPAVYNIGDGDRKDLEKQLLRKIDIRMMPLMMLICMLCPLSCSPKTCD
jgi:hypothetical protein